MRTTILGVAGAALVGAGLITAPVAASAASVTVPAHSTLVRSGCTTAHYKPTSYVLACADANSLISHASYTSWNRHSAHGTGTFKINDCTPDCAAGHFHSYPARLHLFRERSHDGVAVFTRMRVDYTRKGTSQHYIAYLPVTAP